MALLPTPLPSATLCTSKLGQRDALVVHRRVRFSDRPHAPFAPHHRIAEPCGGASDQVTRRLEQERIVERCGASEADASVWLSH